MTAAPTPGSVPASSRAGRVTVVGSLNLDRSLYVAALPSPGATVHAREQVLGPGGKGANQAVAAARFGAAVRLLGAVGDDDAGRLLLDAVAGAGVDTGGVAITDEPTGTALIVVDDHGENQIVVLGGANAGVRIDPTEPPSAVVDTDVLLLQLETPLATQLAAAQVTRATVVLNPAPMPPGGQLTALLEVTDVLVPNRTELTSLLGLHDDVAGGELLERARSLATPRRTLVVTLGAQGAAVVTPEHLEVIDGVEVAAVDATGAGDTFCGVLAAELARGVPLTAAVGTAVQASALTVTRRGAQASFPTRAELGERRVG